MKISDKDSILLYKTKSLLLCCLLTSCWMGLAAGCSDDAAREIMPVTISAPEAFESDGMKWRREARLGPSDTRILSRFFETNPSMVDSPIMKGVPSVYHGTSHRRRFYWIKGTASEPVWVCVHFERGAFQLLEGVGSPYGNRRN
tara:strand:+ start:172968 stop:173399 length:432 start_codon:yes stop_codon:yes gene_type:complete